MNGKIYLSSIEPPEWSKELDYFTYWVCPRKWWSIKDWRLALEFRKSVRLFYLFK